MLTFQSREITLKILSRFTEWIDKSSENFIHFIAYSWDWGQFGIRWKKKKNLSIMIYLIG